MTVGASGRKGKERMTQQARGRNVGVGVLVGIFVAAAFSAIASVFYAIEGPDGLDRSSVPLVQILGAYFGSGVVGGALVGWLLPYSGNLVGAVVVGIVGLLPFYLSLAFTIGSPLIDGLMIAIPMGGYCGYYFLRSKP